ncbi:hypothetical protein CYMTET_30211 [Cymbomonas tetramitiformis]|uniref:Uncharacterized protein n=1 Tax=Cymbomonas tetramitiformis TaxID=36881 RepID=A0AAE0KUE6_9CHLO|nr:hypothetical protein CYMTET_30211 [Cymbomonas tetramitiformis]
MWVAIGSQVEDLSDNFNPQSLLVLLYYSEIPEDRVSQHTSTFSTEGLYSIALSANDLYEGDYYVSVRVGPEATLYRTIALLTSAPMKIQDHVAGVMSAKSYRTGGSGHRKAKEPQLPPALRRPGHIFAPGASRHEPRNLQAYPQRRRTLLEEVDATTQAEVDHSYDANLGHSTLTMEEIANYSSVSVSFKLKLHTDEIVGHATISLLAHTGDFFYLSRTGHAPVKRTPPYRHTKSCSCHDYHLMA